jgi:membrane protease YdiL (CAAX protease family)
MGSVTLAVLALVGAPLFETLLLQWLVFRIACRRGWLPRRALTISVVSGLLFGATHFYSPGYMVWTSAVGTVFALGFLFSGTFKRGFWVVCFAHVGFNAVAVLFENAFAK